MASLSADPVLPFDVRLMNGVASLLYLLVGLGLLGAALLWLARSPWLTIRSIQVEGDLQRSNLATIRANAAPRLSGNFVTIDLDKARDAFEAVPWVRQATLKRVWPNRLGVHLEEHRAAALWLDDDGDDKLVNEQGEVFEANLGDVEDDALPLLAGPPGTAPQMLALYRRLAPLFEGAGLELRGLHLSGRGSWRADLDRRARVEIGRGTEDELEARTGRFVRTVGQLTGRWQRDFEYADLRHADGYAVRLRGITTTVAPAGATANRPR